jgi:hemolysin III
MLAQCPITETVLEGAGSRADVAPHSITRLDRAEWANTITHGLGLLLSLVAAPVLLLEAARRGDALQFAACAIYVSTMVAVYATSTCSHVFCTPRLRQLFRMLDQGFIYLFIAGTFTPIAATYLRAGSWWILPAAIWTVALSGFVSKVWLVHRIDCASVVVPVLLGWMPLTGGPALLEVIPAGLVWWMLAGGICYTAGTLFLMCDHRHHYLHAVWHLFVIAGSACHFFAIWRYTLPTA